MGVQSHRELRVWQRAMDLVEASYRITDSLPRDERYGLTPQIRRAAVSVVANIAEGNRRLHRAEYVHHLSIARGSLGELEAHFDITSRLRYIKESDLKPVRELIDHVSRMLTMMIKRLSRSRFPPPSSRFPSPGQSLHSPP